uniref:hypothetical protein n=1 Tax=Streptomyces sp. CA-141956 TaxID=3240051 RepID=UPI003F49A9F9
MIIMRLENLQLLPSEETPETVAMDESGCGLNSCAGTQCTQSGWVGNHNELVVAEADWN